jgi:pimeloyl-ACP methyl ester carboxylesterase
LHEAGLRTLAPDQRGYSPGARPSDRDSYRLDELVADVLALIDASGRERVHLVGHDWGGALAWLVAGNHPARIASLTVLSTPHPAAMSRAWRTGIDQKRRSWYMAAFQVPWVPEHAVAATFHSLLTRSGLPAEDRRWYAVRLAHADALMTTRGIVRSTIPPASGTPIVLRASGGPSILRELSDERIAVAMEDAARINARVQMGGAQQLEAAEASMRQLAVEYELSKANYDLMLIRKQIAQRGR